MLMAGATAIGISAVCELYYLYTETACFGLSETRWMGTQRII